MACKFMCCLANPFLFRMYLFKLLQVDSRCRPVVISTRIQDTPSPFSTWNLLNGLTVNCRLTHVNGKGNVCTLSTLLINYRFNWACNRIHTFIIVNKLLLHLFHSLVAHLDVVQYTVDEIALVSKSTDYSFLSESTLINS